MQYARAYAFIYNLDEVDPAMICHTDILAHWCEDETSDDLMDFKLYTAIWAHLGISSFMPSDLLLHTGLSLEELFLKLGFPKQMQSDAG